MVFYGKYDHTFDAKNRLTIPSKLRALLAERVVVSMPTDQRPCLTVWRPEDHARRSDETLAMLPAHSPHAAELRRWLYGNSHETELDSAGRVMVPGWMTDTAGIGREVVITGMGDSFEVWDREAWASHNTDLPPTISEIIASLGQPA